jgi:tight adherence protein C
VTTARIGAGLAAALGTLALRDLVAPLLSIALRRGPPRAGKLAALGPRLGSLGLVRRLEPPRDLEARLIAAGRPGGLRPRDWMALKVGAAAAASPGSATILAAGRGPLALFLAVSFPLAGFMAPDFWLARAVRARADAALRELPDLLDLLRVEIAAGVAPVRAMGAVAAEFEGPLAVEWRRVATAVSLGAPQAAAIGELAKRVAADEVKALVETLVRSRRHGLPIGPALGAQAARARDARRRRIRERAARAGPKMQLVVALVLVPSMLLIVAALLVGQLEPVLEPLA